MSLLILLVYLFGLLSLSAATGAFIVTLTRGVIPRLMAFSIFPILLLATFTTHEHLNAVVYHQPAWMKTGAWLVIGFATLLVTRNLASLYLLHRGEAFILSNARSVPWVYRQHKIPVHSLAAEAGLSGAPEILISDLLTTALVLGRAKVVLPASLFSNTREDFREGAVARVTEILKHEFRHIERADHWIRLLQSYSMLLLVLPWEWLVSEESNSTRSALKALVPTVSRFHQLQRLMEWDEQFSRVLFRMEFLGRPFRALLHAEIRQSEANADGLLSPSEPFKRRVLAWALAIGLIPLNYYAAPSYSALKVSVLHDFVCWGHPPLGWNTGVTGDLRYRIGISPLPGSHEWSLCAETQGKGELTLGYGIPPSTTGGETARWTIKSTNPACVRVRKMTERQEGIISTREVNVVEPIQTEGGTKRYAVTPAKSTQFIWIEITGDGRHEVFEGIR